MDKACRIIIEDIINGKINTRRELEVEKRNLCRTRKLKSFMSNYVIIEHEEGYETKYEHLKESIVEEGDIINEGDKIGYVGKTGMCTGSCLHFELRYNGTSINPADYFGE